MWCHLEYRPFRMEEALEVHNQYVQGTIIDNIAPSMHVSSTIIVTMISKLVILAVLQNTAWGSYPHTFANWGRIVPMCSFTSAVDTNSCGRSITLDLVAIVAQILGIFSQLVVIARAPFDSSTLGKWGRAASFPRGAIDSCK